MRVDVVWSVARTTFREFWRTPEAVFWTYAFPVVMAVVLGFAFQPGDPEPIAVVVEDTAASRPLAGILAESPRLKVELVSPEEADVALVRGRAAVLVGGDPAAPRLRIDLTRQDAELGKLLVEDALQSHAGRTDPLAPRIEPEDRPGSRYIDFLIPGLMGLNLLGAGMWGVGYNIVNLRTKSLLRRLMVTPMRRSEFLLGFLLSRIVLMIPEAAAILLFGHFLFDVPIRGSLVAMFVLVTVGGLAFAGLGCLVASRPRTTEGVGGLMNLVLIPMWLLGGSFFSNERFEGVLAWIAEAMPLTHLNRALRDNMLSGAGLDAVVLPVMTLAVFTVLCFALALKIFRWS